MGNRVLKAEKRNTGATNLAGTTVGEDAIEADGLKPYERMVLKSVVFYTAGTIASLEIIMWDKANNERAGKIGGSGASEQTWAGNFEVPQDAEGNSFQVRVVTTGQSAHVSHLNMHATIERVAREGH